MWEGRQQKCGTVRSATDAPTAYLCPVSIAAMMKVSKNSEGGFPSGQLETEGPCREERKGAFPAAARRVMCEPLERILHETRSGKGNNVAHQHTQKKAQQQGDDLTGEHAVGDAGQMVLACLFPAMWIADTFFFKYTTFLNHYVPLAVRIPSGVVLLVLSAYLAKTGLSIVFGERATSLA